MSRKSISIVVPQKSLVSQESGSNVTSILESRAENRADQWVRQEEPAASPAPAPAPVAAPGVPGALTFTIPAEPDWMDMTRIGLFLPQMAFWYWTINAAKKNLGLFLR
jgi:hypothetical protein